jgi:sulfate/thiosulfate transport system permease protein
LTLARPAALGYRPLRLGVLPGGAALRGVVMLYLSLLVLLPLAAVAWKSTGAGAQAFRDAITSPESVSALELTFLCSLLVIAVNAVAGTLIAWVLVRDSFWGRSLIDSLIDLPFALPTIVAGVTLLALYGPNSPLHLNLAYTRAGIVLALLFESLPFVVRQVQPVLYELDREMEEAAASLGASAVTIFRRIILPSVLPAILSGSALGFARSMGEFGAVVLLSGNIPFQTEVASVHIYGEIQSNNLSGAAAISLVLLAASLLVLLALSVADRWTVRRG